MSQVKVSFAVDVEIWPGGWTDIDDRFAEAFKAYVYGPTPFGEYGLPMTLDLRAHHALTGIFFVEPMVSARYSLPPLAEILGRSPRPDQGALAERADAPAHRVGERVANCGSRAATRAQGSAPIAVRGCATG